VKTVHTATTEIEAVTLQGLLEEAGIPVILYPIMRAGLPEPVLPVERWDLLVPDGRADEARAFITEYLESVESVEEAEPR